MGAPDTIKRLVDTFQRNIDVYKNGSINETQLRREFLDPFFTALGWDVENKAGYADAYKDVIHEYSLKTKDVREAPDYCFRIGGTRKFFVEAKKPSVNVKDDIHPAFQLRSYAWSAKLPLSVLTDFEEFAVYDCRIPPNKNDKASNARIMFITYDQFIDKWNEIENIFARESILKGSFDKYVESNKKKKGTAEVDLVFLEQMEVWRKALAKNIALRNPHLSIRELNYSVQKTIDRIIFLRICEDRGIEDYGQLMSLQNGTSVYERLKQIFQRADEKYNSGLFHFEIERDRIEPPDNLTLDLSVDDKTIKDIVKELYYPESPYEFSVLPADILGQVYEQFLGKVIRLTAGHQAVIEDKPEVKKAGGVYYTPTYIVDYIVNNTLGKLISPLSQRGDTGGFQNPKQLSNLKVLDPACGSGSFLLGAYQYLLDWHLKYYLNELETSNKLLQQKHPPVYLNDRGVYLLTTSEKKRILLNNIYGVDIDSQAVEVTKLSLMLKVLEGESTQTLNNELQFFRERALPDLSNNIKCGNSLIGPDFYNQTEMNFLDDEEKMRINVFDWYKEFPQVFKTTSPSIPLLAKEREEKGEVGFDVVIGNPPYLKLTNNSFDLPSMKYFANNYKSIHGGSSKNLFQLFIEKIVSLNPKYFSFIVPEALLVTSSNKGLRDIMIDRMKLSDLVIFDKYVFKDANIGTTIFVLEDILGSGKNSTTNVSRLNSSGKLSLIKSFDHSKESVNWDTTSENTNSDLLKKIEQDSVKLGSIASMSKGMVVKDRKEVLTKVPTKDSLPFLLGSSIIRYEYCYEYYANYSDLIIIGGTRDYSKQIRTPRLLIRRTGNKLCLVYSDKQELVESTLYILTSNEINLKSLIAILNSKLLTFYLQQKLLTNVQGYPQVLMWQLEELPIKILENDNELFIKLSKLSDAIIQNLIYIKSIKTPTERTAIERQIQATDEQIDQLVYQLYGLTEEEIKIVEGTT